MAQITLPAIDVQATTGWTEQDRNLYNRLPFYLAKMQLKYRKFFATHSRLVGKKKWTPNMGDIMRSVSKEPSPHLRQFAFPNRINDTPKKDVIDVRERAVDAFVNRHRFESPILNFTPSFRDFLTDHVDFCGKDIVEKQTRFNDVFVRGNILQQSPYIFIANSNGVTELETAPIGVPTPVYDAANKITTLTDTGNGGKTSAYFQALVAKVGNPGNLSLNTANLLMNIMETDLRMPPFQGTGNPQGDSEALNGYYCMVQSGESFNQYTYDPFVLKYKTLDFDVVNDGFKGNLFGRVKTKLEDLPIRMLADGTFPDPETRELDPQAFNYGESVPNPDYVNAPFEFAFFYAYGEGYQTIEVGPPPKDFSGSGMPKGFGNMFWNGELIITKNLIVPALDADGNATFDTNKYGENLQIISQVTCGIVGEQKRSVIPVLFKRTRGARLPV